METRLCQYFQGCPSDGLALEETSKALSNCVLQSPFQKQKTIKEVVPQRLTQMGGFICTVSGLLGSCPSRLLVLSYTFCFYPSIHQGISLVLYSCKAGKDSSHFPDRRAGEVSAARGPLQLVLSLRARNAMMRSVWGAEFLSSNVSHIPAFPACVGHLAKGWLCWPFICRRLFC